MRHPFWEIGNRTIPVLAVVIICLFASFRFIQNFNTLFIGKWNAIWIIKNSDLGNGSNNNMQGHMEFHENGMVGIEARGYPGCIFSSDTIQNELMWKTSNDSLFLFNQSDHFRLSYYIQKATHNTIELKLLDDIVVTLKR